MLRHLIGFALPWFGLLVWALADRRDGLWQSAVAEQWPLVAVKLIALPVATAWFILDGEQWRRPRRAFDHRVRTGVLPVIRGILVGLLAALLAAAGLAVIHSTLMDASAIRPDYLDATVIGAACVAASLVGAFTLRRSRAGHCIHCGYDLRATPDRCPECGAVGSAVAARAAGRTLGVP